MGSSLYGYVPFLVNTSRSSFMICHRVCNYINTTGATSGAGTAYPSGAPLFTPAFSGVRVTRSLVLYVCFVDCCLSFCTFSFGHCVVCSSIYGYWLPLWYLQAHLSRYIVVKLHAVIPKVHFFRFVFGISCLYFSNIFVFYHTIAKTWRVAKSWQSKNHNFA